MVHRDIFPSIVSCRSDATLLDPSRIGSRPNRRTRKEFERHFSYGAERLRWNISQLSFDDCYKLN